jgi:hypothetical protein
VGRDSDRGGCGKRLIVKGVGAPGTMRARVTGGYWEQGFKNWKIFKINKKTDP